MAIQVQSFTTNLATLANDRYVFTSSFAADFELGQVTLHITNANAADIPDGTNSPVFRGIQENIEIWLDSGVGENYDTLLFAGSFNGGANFVWPTRDQRILIDSASELRLIISNRYALGRVFGNIIINTI